MNTEFKVKNDVQQFKRNSDNVAKKPKKSSSNSSKKAPKKPGILSKIADWLDKIPNWLLALGLTNLALAAASFLTSTLVVALYQTSTNSTSTYPQNSAPGSPCALTSDCVLYAYCQKPSGSTTGYCTCGSDYYYVSGTSCTARLSSGSCTSTSQCNYNAQGLTCTGSPQSCGCTSTQFYNTTSQQCQPLNPPYDFCTATSQCSDSNSACTQFDKSGANVKRCTCNTGYTFNPYTGACTLLLQQGVACSYNWQCISGAYCGLNGGSTNLCWCDNYFYYSGGACVTREYSTSTSSVSCNIINQCNLYDFNQRCIAGNCGCDQKYETFDTTTYTCISLSRYSQTCTTTADCVSGFTCALPDFGGARKICRCTAYTFYFDEVSQSCKPVKANTTLCTLRKECDINSQCITLGGGTQTRCYCITNYAYYDSTTSNCQPVLSFGSPCTSSTQCNSAAGLTCLGSCACPTTQFYNTTATKCQWLGLTGDFCTQNSECYYSSCTSNACL